jgi:Right handed beta helix region
VWISARTDGLPGAGTQADPFNGSTQAKFDGIFLSYMKAGTTSIAFHIGPGTFSAKGAWGGGWAMLDGWHIIGAGKDQTTIYQSGGAVGFNRPIFSYRTGHENNQSVEDLTVDCAYFRLGSLYPNGNFAAVQLSGSSFIRNVRVLHNSSLLDESFALCIIGTANDSIPNNAFIENCEVLNSGARVSAMAIVNYASLNPVPIYAQGGRITNCYVDSTAHNGAGPPAGFDGCEIRGCTLSGTFTGIYADTFPGKNILIVNNTITAPNAGIYLNDIGLSGVTVTGNTITTPYVSIAFESVVTNSVISSNRIIDAGGGDHLGVVLDKSGVNRITVTDNVVDASSIFLNTAVNVSSHNNLTPSGQLWIPNTY